MEPSEQRFDTVAPLIEARDWPAIRGAVADWPPPEVAQLLHELPKSERVLLYRALPRAAADAVFRHLEVEEQDALLCDLTDEESRHLLATLPPDDRTSLLEELPGRATQRMLNLLSQQDLREARWLLGYPEQSVGRLMTPDYVAVRAHWTIAQALRQVRRKGRDSVMIHRIYVVDDDWRLVDDVELRRLILAEPQARVDSVMDRSFARISAFADREEAVAVIRRYDQDALPVLDSEGVLLGIVTIDDVLDVAEQEATEDFQRVGSVEPLNASLRDASIGLLYRKRIGWLMVLIVASMLSGAGIAHFEDTIASTVALVFFLPVLIGGGGNAGAQSATLMIRALATGDVRASDWLRLVTREVVIALALGLTLAAGVAAISWARAPEVMWVVAATMTLIVLVGSVIGLSLPFVLARLKQDPATASAPLVTSLADICGVVIYFSIASWYLGT